MDPIAVLKRHNIQPSKGLGQSFLMDRDVLRQIVEASEITPADVVLEVGPGVGQLTRALAERAAAVVAVELDRKMIAVLAEELAHSSNVHIIEGDILQVDPVEAVRSIAPPSSTTPLRYKVVANLPYYITSAAIRHLLGAHPRPELMTLMLQSEVAQRIVAQPGEMSLLALGVQMYGTPEVVCHVPSSAFYPRPQVDSAVLRVRVDPQPRVPEAELPRFFQVAQAGFGQKRKQLHNSLAHSLHLPTQVILEALERAGIDAERRAQTLSIAEWATLAQALPTPQPSARAR